MRLLLTVFLTIGLIHAVGAALVFDKDLEDKLSAALSNVTEADGTLDKNLQESKLVGTMVCQDTTDATSTTLEIKLGEGSSYVELRPIGRPFAAVYVKPLDYEVIREDSSQQNEKKIQITCSNKQDESTTFETGIVVTDINDRTPIFERSDNGSYSIILDEFVDERELPKLIYDKNSPNAIIVTDADGVAFNKVEAQCLGMRLDSGKYMDCDGYFSVTVEQLAFGRYAFNIYALKSDYSEEKSYTLEIKAINAPASGSIGRTLESISHNVAINIRDLQNTNPIINKENVTFSMFENLAQNQPLVGFVEAYDGDVGDPHPIKYLIVPPRLTGEHIQEAYDQHFFRLGDVTVPTGSSTYQVPLILNNTIDREQVRDGTKTLYLGILAIEYDPLDRPNREKGTTYETISIKIKDVNDQAPEFSNRNYEVITTELSGISANPDNFQQISNNVEIQVTDSDSTDFNKFTVEITSGNENGDFRLDNIAGNGLQLFNLYAKEAILDYEKLPNRYVMTLRAVDTSNSNFVSSATVTVSLVDANDHDPRFPFDSYPFEINESQRPGLIGTIQATDEDSGSFGTISGYEIIGGDDTMFRIDTGGNIVLQEQLDFETQDVHYLTVAAVDGGSGNNQRTGIVQVVIQLINENDIGPEFERTYTARLQEESTTLNPEITIVARSQDASNPTITYNIVGVKPLTVPISTFAIDSSTGVLSVRNQIDYKQTINNTPQGIVTVNVSARAGDLFAYTSVVISIEDLNNFPPVFVNPPLPSNTYKRDISELEVAGYSVIDLNVTDQDGPDTDNGRVTFRIQSGANDDFVITRDSGIIKVTSSAKLDIEDNQKSYEIVVVAVDKGRRPYSATATVIINLLDANNKNPYFLEALYRFQAREYDPIGNTIGIVTAMDLDSDNVLEYSIDFNSVTYNRRTNNQDPIDATKIIKMDTDNAVGLIKVAGNITRVQYDRINFNVLVEDTNVIESQPRQFATASVVIFILAIKDPAIYFSNGEWTKQNPVVSLSFSESNNINYQILSLKATDPSIPETIQNYRIREGSDINDYFSLRGTYLYMKKKLDYEALPDPKRLSVVILAISSDQQKTGTATVFVTVQDLNDNAPEFDRDLYVFDIEESKKSPTIVGSLKATDRDTSSFGQVNYSFAGSQTDFGIYRGNDDEGVIFIKENVTLNYEGNPKYNLVVLAEDNPGKGNTVKFVTPVDVVINLIDENDMSPVFKEPVYNITIVGTKEPGDEAYDIIAEDGDAGINGQVNYAIKEATQNGRDFFGIKTDRQTTNVPGEEIRVGTIFVRSSLESLPDRALFVLTVIATDEGFPTTTPGTCTVFITVSKGTQDLKPKWNETLPARVQIKENEPPNTFIATLNAFPAEVTSSIIYSFVGAGDALRDYDKFTINPNTGTIRTKVALDYETQIIFSLLVLATDSLNKTLTNQYLLIVEVLDVDDNHPSFADCPNKVYNMPEEANVDEERKAPVFVYRAEACDADDPPLNLVQYSWFIDRDYCPDNRELFELSRNNGQISTSKMLDREAVSEYMLCIEVSRPDIINPERDLQSLNNSNKLLFLKVKVRDANDLGPKFYESKVKTIILQYPETSVSVAEAYDLDLAPNNGIRYSIDSIDFTIRGKTQAAPAAFTINTDGSIIIGTNDYSEYTGGYFDINVKAEDENGANVPPDHQLQRVYVTDRSKRIRVIFDEPADSMVNKKANDMIDELNELYEDSGMYYEIETISYHVVSNNADPSFDKTDVCLVVVENDNVLSAVSASKRLTDVQKIQGILDKYGAVDPGSCDPAVSVYPIGWESYWWVLVAFAIFIFVCCLILIVLICILFKQYRQYMDSRKTYLVPN